MKRGKLIPGKVKKNVFLWMGSVTDVTVVYETLARKHPSYSESVLSDC